MPLYFYGSERLIPPEDVEQNNQLGVVQPQKLQAEDRGGPSPGAGRLVPVSPGTAMAAGEIWHVFQEAAWSEHLLGL